MNIWFFRVHLPLRHVNFIARNLKLALTSPWWGVKHTDKNFHGYEMPMNQCIDPAVSAQVRQLKHKHQRGFAYPGLGEATGGCKSQSSHQWLGWRVAGSQSAGDACIAPWACGSLALPFRFVPACRAWWTPVTAHSFWPTPWSCGWWIPAHCLSAARKTFAPCPGNHIVQSRLAQVPTQ